jgi:DnaD/phage-associated family protein
MAKRMPWFRLYAGDMLKDRKLKRISKQTNIDLATVTGAWVRILCLASESPDRGWLLIDGGLPMEYEEMCADVGLDVLRFDALLKQFMSEEFDMMAVDAETSAYLVTKWNERQFKSDNSTARVRKYRAKKRSNETLQKRYSNALDTETESDTDTETEQTKDAAAVFTFYSENFGVLTSGISERIGDAIDEYSAAWVLDAMGISLTRNKRRWDYVEGILRNWATNGKDDGKKPTQKNNAVPSDVYAALYGEK